MEIFSFIVMGEFNLLVHDVPFTLILLRKNGRTLNI